MLIGLIVFSVIFFAVCLVAGIWFRKGNGLRWVNFLDYKAGKYDEPRLLRFIGSAIILWGAILSGGWIVCGITGIGWIAGLAVGVFLAAAIAAVVYMNTGGRFLK